MDSSILLFGVLGLLLVFMIFNTRRRSKAMKAEQEQKRSQTVPGAKVLLQGGLYGTVVAYDAEDLDHPALIEIAPGTVIEVHSQAILRIVDPVDADEDEYDELPESIESAATEIETPEQTRARLDRENNDK